MLLGSKVTSGQLANSCNIFASQSIVSLPFILATLCNKLPPNSFCSSARITRVPDFAAAAPAAASILSQPPIAEATGTETSKDRIARAFGDGVVSQKPLDEVVLDYLVASARKRKRPPS